MFLLPANVILFLLARACARSLVRVRVRPRVRGRGRGLANVTSLLRVVMISCCLQDQFSFSPRI